MSCKTDSTKTDCNERTADLGLPFVGGPAQGRVTTSLDNGNSRWYPLIKGPLGVPLYRDDIYLESKRNSDGSYSPWTATGDVFNEIRATNPSIKSAYSTNDALRSSFFSAGTGTGSPVGTLNTGRINQFKTNGAPVAAQQLGLPGLNNTAQASPESGDQQAGESQQQTNIPTGETTPIPGQNELNTNPKLAGEQLPIVPKGTVKSYPKSIGLDQDYIKFTAHELLARTGSQAGGAGGLGFTFGDIATNQVAGPVCIAIQSPISDQNSVDWGPDTVNAIDAALYSASIGLMKDKTKDLGKSISDLAGNIQKELRGQGGRFGRYLGGQAAGINNVLARTDNIVLNPNLELLFQGPQLRPFSFTFKMSAREQGEANDIKTIIKYFKYHMAVRKENPSLFLRAPHVFKIEYQYGKTDLPHPGINLIKMCALTNCSVDYTPLGSYMTYQDGTMVAYTINLQFQELTPIYDTDYTDSQPIGL